jgi:hypothetical protein
MGKPLESIVGKKFHRLTVLEEFTLPTTGTKTKRRMARCQCECGKIVCVGKYALIYGHTKSCGCYRGHKYEELNLIGRRFSHLVVLERFKIRRADDQYRYMARCQCDCGKVTEVGIPSLLLGTTTSCGCRRDQYEKISGKNSTSFTGFEEITGTLWGKIRKQAETRGLEFDIGLQYAWGLFQEQNGCCALTGIPLTLEKFNQTASLDRIDSSRGYVEGNVHWVYRSVNIMRNAYSIEHFTEICLLVAKKHGWAPSEGQATSGPSILTTSDHRHHIRYRYTTPSQPVDLPIHK